MGDLKEFKRPKHKSRDLAILRSAGAVIFLLVISASLIPFFLVTAVFYWFLPIGTRLKFKEVVNVVNFYLEDLLKDFENGKRS